MINFIFVCGIEATCGHVYGLCALMCDGTCYLLRLLFVLCFSGRIDLAFRYFVVGFVVFATCISAIMWVSIVFNPNSSRI